MGIYNENYGVNYLLHIEVSATSDLNLTPPSVNRKLLYLLADECRNYLLKNGFMTELSNGEHYTITNEYSIYPTNPFIKFVIKTKLQEAYLFFKLAQLHETIKTRFKRVNLVVWGRVRGDLEIIFNPANLETKEYKEDNILWKQYQANLLDQYKASIGKLCVIINPKEVLDNEYLDYFACRRLTIAKVADTHNNGIIRLFIKAIGDTSEKGIWVFPEEIYEDNFYVQ